MTKHSNLELRIKPVVIAKSVHFAEEISTRAQHLRRKKEKYAAKNVICKNCKKQAHFMELCYSKKKVNCIKIEKVNRTKCTNIVRMKALRPNSSVNIEAEADTGANITVLKAELL